MSEPTRDTDGDTTKPRAQELRISGSRSPALTSHPLTFMDEHPTDRLVSRPQISKLPDLSVVDLPQLVAAAPPELTTPESVWSETPGLMSPALTPDISLTALKLSHSLEQGSTEISKKKSQTKCSTLTGIEVFEIFTQKKNLGGLQFYHLKASEDGSYRPYDLHVVPCSKAGLDHYIFSPTSVIHVKEGCSVGLISLAEWYRQAILWKALRDIPFFKNYLLHKAFSRWHRSICYILFQRQCQHLQSQLLIAVPQFREALFHLTRLTGKLEKVHWLPQDESHTYTLADFQSTLSKDNQQSRKSIERFLRDCSLILRTVEETCHKSYEEIQQKLEAFQLSQGSKSLYLQQCLSRSLHDKLKQTAQILQKLENFKTLMDCMIVETLVSLTERELMMYLNKTLKREQENQSSLFQADLTFGVDGQLVLCPPMQLFQELLLQALPSVVDSILQVVDACNISPGSQASFQRSTPSPEMTNNTDVPLNKGCKQSGSTLKPGSLPSQHGSGVVSHTKLVLSKPSPSDLQGQSLQRHFYPLSRKQLEWHLHHHSGSREVEKQQAEIIQEALIEIQQLCERHSWLVDAYVCATKWSPASGESIRGRPASNYEEHIQMIQSWIHKVHHVPAAFTTSNKIVTINCSHIQDMLDPLLRHMEKDYLNVLSEELRLCAQNLTSDLKKSMASLNFEPTGLKEFANYFSVVQGYTETDMLQKLKNLGSLQKTIEIHFGNLTPEELTLIEEPFALWDRFVFLLRTATERVMQQLPSMINNLDNTFASLIKQLEDLVYSATTGPYLDLNLNSGQLIPELKIKYSQLHIISAQLNELNGINQILRGQPLDLSFVITAEQHMKARKELWELFDMSTAQIKEWRILQFSQFIASEAQDKLTEWLYQANSVAKFIPFADEVLQETLSIIEKFSQQLSLIVQLSSPTIKQKHWANICKEMGLPVHLGQNLSMGDLMSGELWEHRHEIKKICNAAKAEADMEQAFQRLQQSWEEIAFRLTKFIPNVCQKKTPQSFETQQIKPPFNFDLSQSDLQQNSYGRGTFTIMDLESLMAQAEDSVMTLSSMLMSPHVCDFKKDVEIWLQLLQELGELLDFFKRYQQKWTFLCRIFNEIPMSKKNRELVEKFCSVDQMFHELIQAISGDPYVLNFVRLRKTRETNFDFYGQHLRNILIKGLTAMEEICAHLSCLLDTIRCEFPRLYFLSDEEVVELLSVQLPPSCLLPFVRKCFRGVQWFEVDSGSENGTTNPNSELDLPITTMWINSIYGTLNEHVPFGCPLKYNLNPVVCLDLLEKKLQQTVKQLVLKCIVAQQCYEPEGRNSPEQNEQVNDNFPTPDPSCIFIASAKDEEKSQDAIASSFIKLISEYPLQCLLVAEEVRWCSDMCKDFVSQAQNKWTCIKAKHTEKLQNLCKAVQEKMADSYTSGLATQRTVTALRAIILLLMKHSQQIADLVDIKGGLESSFEWQRLLKYRHGVILDNVGQDNSCSSEDSVYVDVFGTQLDYGNEYIGPENWMMVNTTSTERARLGILLALTSFKCAFISGPLMSGKQRTALQLGWALGQQVITLRCCSNTRFPVVCQMLLGALQSGAWLVLGSVDLLEQEILSTLGQCLTDIHQCLSIILEQRELQHPSEEVGASSIVGPYVKKDRRNMTKIKCQVLYGDKNILAKPNYGCILISLNGYSAKLPENLRITLRPVSIMQPDSNVIAEVLLTSLGFSEATTISRRLISLLSLGKDLFCLPEYVCRKQCSWLVLLRKIIDAAGIYLHKKIEETDEEREPDLRFKANENTLQDCHLPPHKLSSKSFMSNAVREEQALVKGVMSVLLSAISDHNKALQFCTLFQEIFPTAIYCTTFQYLIEESERNVLRNAVTGDLQHTPIRADAEILHNVLNLHQALKFSTAVVIFGPAGSGKTTVYRALARALRRLAEAPVEDPVAKTNLSAPSCWCSVDTIVLFPNVLSNEELFGACCEKGFWRDGAFTKVLRNTEQQECFIHSLSQIKQKDEVQKVKWLVLDGEPCPEWFDTLSTLGNPENPFVCLSSGKKIHLSPEGIKILVETTSLREATPSALGRCSLVCISGLNVWKNVWKSEMDALYREHVLEQNTLETWKFMAEDLFSSTLIFLRHKGLTSVMATEGLKARKTSPANPNGLQEVMSFIKILRALVWDSRKRDGLKSGSKKKRDFTHKPPIAELHARNFFAIAYIWGFGGQLHPRHWPQFDSFAREALFQCHYKIEVPDKGTVFEHFFDVSDKTLEDAACKSRFSKNSTPQHCYTPVPQYKNHAYLLNHLLEAHYPALLVADAGSGKTILCKNVLQDRPHLHVPVSPCLSSADLRNILERIRAQNTSLDSSDSIVGPQRLILFIDDLHESAFGKTSGTLETLRLCISRDRMQTSDGYHFKHFSSKAVSYLGTCRIPEAPKSGPSQISLRLSRLFTILVLPVMTADILFSIHSSQLDQWLKNFPPMPRLEDMARCIVVATFDVYLAVHKHLSSSAYSPHIVFSLHDLQKVFQGMFLFDPRTTVQSLHQRNLPSPSLLAVDPDFLGAERHTLGIARLWMHECLRTFGDRLSSNEETQKLVSFLLQASEKNFCSHLEVESQIVGNMPDSGCQLKSTAIADRKQHRHKTKQQDNDQCTSPRAKSATPRKVLASKEKSKSTKSGCSEELSGSTSVEVCVKPPTISLQPQQLLRYISSSVREMVFSPEFSRLHICRAQKQLNHNILYQERDLDVLIEQLANIVKSKDAKETYRRYATFAVYHQRVRQLVHVLRALLIPNGHGVLFGAAKKTGRKTTIRLAAFLTGNQLIEVHCGNEVKLKDLLKEARRQIDTHGEHVIFMVHENISQATMDELLLIMETWHHFDEEPKEVRPNISAVVKNSPDQRIGQVNKRYFRSKQRHIHVFLLMPLSQHNRERETDLRNSSVTARHIAKALTLCCCVEVYHPWSTEALVEVASVYLKDSADYSALVASIAQAMAAIHQSATKYACETVFPQPFSPQTYIELIEYFSHHRVHLNGQVKTHAHRMRTVVAHLKDLNDTAQDYRQEASRLNVKFQETQKELNRLQMDEDAKRAVCEQTHQNCVMDERQLYHLQEQLDLAEQQAQDALEEDAPLYQAALKAMLSLNQSDLDEVRHYRHPPDGVVTLMNAICMLFDCPCNWESCKQLFGQPRFLEELQFFDHSKINNELFEELEEIVQSPNFQTDLVCEVSQACESLCSWVRAVYQYACVKRSMAPHEAHKQHLNNCMAEIREQLHIGRLQEEAAQEGLEDVMKQHQFVRNNLQELSVQLYTVEIQDKEASLTIEQLSNFAENWNMAKEDTEMNEHTIPGDALLIAAAITYLGPFGPDIRLDLLKKWHKMCLTGKIRISPEDVRSSLFDEPQLLPDEKTHFVNIPVATELQRALTQALERNRHLSQALSPNYVLELLLWGHKAPWVHKWALLTDTEQHNERRSYKMLIEYADQFLINAEGSEKDEEFELIVSADDPECIQQIRHGAEKGLKVLVTEIERATPEEGFLSVLDRPDFHHTSGVTKQHPKFCLFLSTSLPSNVLLEEIHPLILEKVNVIDLSLSTSEVQGIILSDLTQTECSELWSKHCQLQQDKLMLQKSLHIEEVSLSDYILQSSSPLLQDPEFLSHVQVCQITSLRLREEIEELSNEMDSHKPIISYLQCIAALATALYRALQDVGSLYPFYFFPLCKFLMALRETLAQKGWLDVPCSAEILHRIVSDLLAYYTPYLFQSHAELLRLYFSVALFMHTEECSELEREVFLRGFSNEEMDKCHRSPEQSAPVLPSWIPTHAKPLLGLLEKIPHFHGLITSLKNSSRQWQEYFHFPSATVVGPVPCQSHSHLTTIQRAILWKTFCPQWLAAVADDLFACQLGRNVQSAVEDSPQTSSPEAFSSLLSRNTGPIIVTMPSQIENEARCIHPLYWIKHSAMHHGAMEGIKVVVLSFGSKCQEKNLILSLLNKAVRTGHWLVLNNCHLLDRWDPKVITKLTQYIGKEHWTNMDTELGLTPNRGCAKIQVHPQFRLWFITNGNAPRSIPAFIRTCATHLVFDSQWDLKDELCASFRHVTPTVPPATNVDPIPRAAILHSVLMQRQKVQHLGHGDVCKWSYEDLLALMEAHAGVAALCHDPVQALEYIAAYLVYGGHVSDSADLENVAAVCRVCLQPPPSIRGSGPHILSEMISIKGHFDEDILKDVQNCIETTLNNNDTLLLGFSAEMKKDIVKMRSRALRNLLLRSEHSFGATGRDGGVSERLPELTDYGKARERIRVLQTRLEPTKRRRVGGGGKVSGGPIHAFLQTEWENLAKVVSALLEGGFQQPQDLPASLNLTPSMTSELETRANLLQTYQMEERASPRVYCLSAFANPRGFLAALIREAARAKHSDISQVSLHYQVPGAAAFTPSDGICLSGLALHGASWDTQLGTLQDTLSSEPCPFPPIWVRAQVRSLSSAVGGSSYTASSNSYSMPLYNCPLYLEGRSKDGDWSLSADNIVTHVPVRTRLEPVLCRMRRVRLVSALQENKLR